MIELTELQVDRATKIKLDLGKDYKVEIKSNNKIDIAFMSNKQVAIFTESDDGFVEGVEWFEEIDELYEYIFVNEKNENIVFWNSNVAEKTCIAFSIKKL
jgi:hypothetical protein